MDPGVDPGSRMEHEQTLMDEASSDNLEVQRTHNRTRLSRLGAARDWGRYLNPLLTWGTLVALVVAPLLIGGVHFTTGLALSLTGIALGTIAVASHRDIALRPSWVLSALLLWVAVTALQLIPMPLSILESLNPHIAGHYQRTFTLLGNDGAWAPLSLSPQRTAMALWHALGFVGFYLVASLHLRDRERFTAFVPKLLTVGVIFGGVALLQTTFFTESILGLYTPKQFPPGPVTSTLINANNAGGLLGASSAIALGCALSERHQQRVPFILIYIMLTIAMLLMLSRGAMLAWAASHLVFLFLVKARRPLESLGRGALPLTAAVILALGGLVYAAYGTLESTFVQLTDVVTGESEGVTSADVVERDVALLTRKETWLSQAADIDRKFSVYRDLDALFEDYQTTGLGRSAFVEVYPSYSTLRAQRTAHSVENEYIEMALEYGLPFAITFFLLLGFGVLRAMARPDWRDAEHYLIAGLCMAISLLALQNLVDFSMRIPGVAFFMAVVLGLVIGRDQRYRDVSSRRKDTPSARIAMHIVRWASGLLLVAALLVAFANLSAAERGVSSSDIESLKSLASQRDGLQGDTPQERRDFLVQRATPTLQARPVDGFLRFLIGVALFQTGEGGAEPSEYWLREAVAYHPNDYRIHFTLAQVLAAQSQFSEATRELATAAELNAGPSRPVYAFAARALRHPSDLQRSLSTEPVDWEILGNALLERRRYDDALELGEYLDQQHPHQPQGLDLQIKVHLALGFPEAAVEPARTLVERFPRQPNVLGRMAAVHVRLKDFEKAHLTLLQAIELHPKNPYLLFQHTRLLLHHGHRFIEDETERRKELDASMTRLRPVALSHKPLRPSFYVLRGTYYTRFDNPRQARRAFDKALEQRPDDRSALLGAFQASLTLGDLERASDLLDILSKTLTEAELLRMREALAARRVEIEERRSYFDKRKLE